MSSEQLADGVNPLDAELAATWDVLKGYSGRDTDLGIARRFGGAAAAYSLRDIGAMNGRVVKVRRDVDGDGTDKEEDFSANQVSSGALEDWVNGKLESTLPADVDTAAAAYSLRKVKASYSGNAVRIRRTSDDIEVNVAFDSEGKVSASSAITNVAEQGGESGQTTATTLNEFLNANEQTVGVAQNGTSSLAYNSFTGDSNTGFTVTNSDAGTFKQAVFGYESGEGDVIVANFDLNITSGTPTIQVRTGASIGTLTAKSNDVTVSSSTNHTVTLTCTGDGLYIKFLESDACTFSVSNFTIVSHTQGAAVHTWYDQASTNNATQETAANQPKIAENGALLADGIDFDGTDDFLESTTLASIYTGTDTASSAFVVVNSDAASTTQYIIGAGNTSLSNPMYNTLFHSGGNIGWQARDNSGTLKSNLTATPYIADKMYLVSNINSGTTTDFNSNAVVVDNGADSDLGVKTINTVKLGARGNAASSPLNGSMKEAIFYATDQSDNRFKIESNINNYYGLYTFQGDGFVETWYDQSGNGNDATQGTAGNQPTIVQNGGLISDGIQFDGSADALNFTDLTLTDASIFTVLDIDGTENLQIILGGSTSTTTATMIPMMQTSSSNIQVYKNATVGGAEQGNSQFRNGSQITLNNRGDAYAQLAAQDKMLFTMIDVDVAEAKVLDGISQTPSDATTWALKGTMEELIIYNSDLSSDRGTIESEIANHYNITLS